MRPRNHALTVAARVSSWLTVASETSGPPQTRRRPPADPPQLRVHRGGELLDPGGGAVVVEEHHYRLLAGELVQVPGVGAGVRLVGRDDQTGRVGHAAADLAEPSVGGPQHRRDPVTARVERGAPGLCRHVLRQRFAEAR